MRDERRHRELRGFFPLFDKLFGTYNIRLVYWSDSGR
jgi:hypothetical protein